MRSSITELVDRIELLYENIYNLLSGFQQATISKDTNIIVPIKKENGTIEQVSINSFQRIIGELNRLDNNYKSLINADNLSYILNSDGSISQQTKTSFMNAEYLENFEFDGNNCIVDKKSVIDDLIYPMVKLPININSKIISDVYSKVLEIQNGWEFISENPKLIDIEYLNSIGKITYREINRTLKIEKEQVEYFGKFNIEYSVIEQNSNNSRFIVTLNDIFYESLYTLDSSIELKLGDYLVSNTGASKYEITFIDKFTKKVNLTRIAGAEILSVGIAKLYFNEKLEIVTENVVGIPIKPNQKLVVFLSTENIKSVSFPSVGIKINTETYKVIHQGQTYTLDNFFSLFVTNFSEYLLSFINETTIPVSLAIKPTKPILNKINFKVVQINKHLTDSKSVNEIEELNRRKQSIQNEIDFKQSQIDTYQTEIDTLKFKSKEEKTSKLNQITTLRQQTNVLKTNILAITRNIDSVAILNGLKTTTPKYRIIGFWEVQEPIYSPLTKAQNIIKYEVQYRYLSKNNDSLENTSYTMIANGKEVAVTFSAWTDLPTKVLNKIENLDGQLVWEKPILDSAEDININQLMIPINEGESIEVKIRSVSEAGFPIAPVKSEWSEILRIDFPNELKQTTISESITQNENDLKKAEFESILQNAGLLSHITSTIKEGEKTFHHKASDITSGQFSEEQKNIPLDTIISTLIKEINSLKNTEISSNININIVDFNNESFIVRNNTTMELFAGNYTDNFDLLDNTKWGSIIRKRAYIKIRNNNTVPIEIKTLVPGALINLDNQTKYNNVPIKSPELKQATKQIIYFRNVDLNDQEGEAFALYKLWESGTLTFPISEYIDIVANDEDKNLVGVNSEDYVIQFKLKTQDIETKNFLVFTKEHPLFIQGDSIIKPDIKRLGKYNTILKHTQYQNALTSVGEDLIELIGFNDYDFYAVGGNSCGAFLYPLITNPSNIKVIGDTTVSTLIMAKESEILIPIIYEYRMIDRIGNIDGDINFDAVNDLIYSKKIGIDMLINNELFKFDINVSSKLQSKINLIDSININSVMGAYNNEDREIIN